MKKIVFTHLATSLTFIFMFMFSCFSMSSFGGQYEDGASAIARGDYAAALKLFRSLAEQGDASGQFQLGSMYSDGIGVPKDYEKAAVWFRKAAEQGDAVAQIELGKMYKQGKGLPKNYVQAYMWFNLAASQFPSVYNAARDSLAESMTSTQIAEGQKLSREWKPEQSKLRATNP